LQEDPHKLKEAVQDFYAPAQIQTPKKHAYSQNQRVSTNLDHLHNED